MWYKRPGPIFYVKIKENNKTGWLKFSYNRLGQGKGQICPDRLGKGFKLEPRKELKSGPPPLYN